MSFFFEKDEINFYFGESWQKVDREWIGSRRSGFALGALGARER